jgi:hypothetical protein
LRFHLHVGYGIQDFSLYQRIFGSKDLSFNLIDYIFWSDIRRNPSFNIKRSDSNWSEIGPFDMKAWIPPNITPENIIKQIKRQIFGTKKNLEFHILHEDDQLVGSDSSSCSSDVSYLSTKMISSFSFELSTENEEIILVDKDDTSDEQEDESEPTNWSEIKRKRLNHEFTSW